MPTSKSMNPRLKNHYGLPNSLSLPNLYHSTLDYKLQTAGALQSSILYPTCSSGVRIILINFRQHSVSQFGVTYSVAIAIGNLQYMNAETLVFNFVRTKFLFG